jgi:hypothetical protein
VSPIKEMISPAFKSLAMINPSQACAAGSQGKGMFRNLSIVIYIEKALADVAITMRRKTPILSLRLELNNVSSPSLIKRTYFVLKMLVEKDLF